MLKQRICDRLNDLQNLNIYYLELYGKIWSIPNLTHGPKECSHSNMAGPPSPHQPLGSDYLLGVSNSAHQIQTKSTKNLLMIGAPSYSSGSRPMDTEEEHELRSSSLIGLKLARKITGIPRRLLELDITVVSWAIAFFTRTFHLFEDVTETCSMNQN